MHKNPSHPIDFVIPWVDGDDPAWRKLRAAYEQPNTHANDTGMRIVDARDERYCDWGTLRYVLRSIDRFAPWVRTVHLITQGHLPSWLNVEHPKLNIVRHEDYMPARYLPTFATNAIELNLHRIEALAEHFVYFNDDMVLLRDMVPGDFFMHGLPRYVASLEPTRVNPKTWFYMPVTNASIVSKHFSKHRCVARHPLKWFNPRYPRASLKNVFLIPFKNFVGFDELHLPDPYLKSTLREIWDREPALLEQASMHRFRVNTDPNIWLVQDWQMATGRFSPGNERIGKAFFVYNEHDAREAAAYVRSQKGKLTCLNDHLSDGDDADPVLCRAIVMDALNDILPERSAYELLGAD